VLIVINNSHRITQLSTTSMKEREFQYRRLKIAARLHFTSVGTKDQFRQAPPGSPMQSRKYLLTFTTTDATSQLSQIMLLRTFTSISNITTCIHAFPLRLTFTHSSFATNYISDEWFAPFALLLRIRAGTAVTREFSQANITTQFSHRKWTLLAPSHSSLLTNVHNQLQLLASFL
jgi:hypothetical protein